MAAPPDLLFLSHRMPYPPNKGDKIRAHAILKHLSPRYRIHLGCNVDDPDDLRHADTLRKMLGGECLFLPLDRRVAGARAALAVTRGRSLSEEYFGGRRFKNWISQVVRQHSIRRAIAFGSAMAPLVMGEPRLDVSRSILDLVDVDSDKWRQYAQATPGPRRFLYRYEAASVARLERRAAAAFGHTVLVSPFEAATFAGMAPESAGRIVSIGNGVDLNYFQPDRAFASPFPSGKRPIVMTGLMDYRPNIEGAQWFATQVLPNLLRTIPSLQFFVVGANPPPGLLADMPGVTVVGRVPDMRPYLAHAEVVVAPLQIARGVQNKVLEAMAMRRPVVATTAATRALAVTPQRHVLIEDEPDAFADAVLRTFDPITAAGLAFLGRRYVERHHDWSRSLADFDRLLESGAPAPLAAPQTLPHFGLREAAGVE